VNVDGMPNINASVDALLNALDNTIPLVQEFLKDTSFPLEDRWALFLKSEKLLPSDTYGDGHVDALSRGDSLYDAFGVERRETTYYSDMDDMLHENSTPEDSEADEYSEKYDRMLEKRDEWREVVLQHGDGSFTYDW